MCTVLLKMANVLTVCTRLRSVAHSGQRDACLNSLRHPGGILVSFPCSASRCHLDSKLVSKLVEDLYHYQNFYL